MSAAQGMQLREELLNAKIDAVEARLDLKIVDPFSAIMDQLAGLQRTIDTVSGQFGGLETKIEGKLVPLQAAVDAKPGMWKIVATTVGAVATGLALTFGVLAFAGDRFDGGMSAAGALAEQQRETDAKFACVMARLANPKAECE